MPSLIEPPSVAYPGEDGAGPILEQIADVASRDFDAFLERPELADRKVERRFERGGLTDVVLKAQNDFDVVVMGTHGYSGVSRVLFGNHAYRILNEIETPVVVVPQPTVS